MWTYCNLSVFEVLNMCITDPFRIIALELHKSSKYFLILIN